jgi:hypothetical protein
MLCYEQGSEQVMSTRHHHGNKLEAKLKNKPPRRKRSLMLAAAVLALASSGCSSITSPLSGIPARRLPPQFFAPPKNNLVPIDVSRLAQEPPRQYLLDGGDILGIYVEGILPFTPLDQPPELPPVNFPDKDSVLPPSLGYPLAIQEDGTISLPLVRPIEVKGLTVEQVQEKIRRAYLDAKILKEDGSRVLTPIVTLLQERTFNIVVVRQDLGGQQDSTAGLANRNFVRGSDQSASGNLIKLPAGQNDVLHALMATGGLPGVNAKNEIRILRASAQDRQKRDEFVRNFYAQWACNPNPCLCPPPLPDDPAVLKIPMRLPPGVIPSFRQEDVILKDGDIVYIESREAEVFYTGGLLRGGEWTIPRDYDLDVIGAMAIAGGGISSPQGLGGAGIAGGFAQQLGGVPPGKLFILRRTPCNGQITIEVDLAKALTDPRERPLVQAGDTLILRYKCEEEALNFGLGTFFTFGIQALLQGIND